MAVVIVGGQQFAVLADCRDLAVFEKRNLVGQLNGRWSVSHNQRGGALQHGAKRIFDHGLGVYV